MVGRFLRETFTFKRQGGDWYWGDDESWPFPEVGRWWEETYGTSPISISPEMAARVWAANRCIQLNAQQVAGMPLEFFSNAPEGGYEPIWVSSPDPHWFPNGISDAVFAIVRAIYGYGYALLWVTSTYASGFPQSWTVLDPRHTEVLEQDGDRVYLFAGERLNPDRVVQVDRDPSGAAHGTSALSAYATQAWALLAGGELGRSTMQGGTPLAVLKAAKKIDDDQAALIQNRWVARTSQRGGAPPVLGPDLSFESLSLSPADLLLLEGQEFNARVIASAYGVPPFLLNLPLEGGLTYQNPAMLGELWWRFELRPLAKRIADALSAQMLPRGNWVSFDAADTFAPLVAGSEEDDPQLAIEPQETAGATATPATTPTPALAEVRALEPAGG